MALCGNCNGLGWVASDLGRSAVLCPSCNGKQTVPFERQSETSRVAAESMAPLTGKMRKRIFAYIHKAGDMGRINEEIETGLDLRHQSASPRVRELWQMGRIGTESKRRTSSGRPANVWKSAFYCSDPEATVATVERHTCPECGCVF